MTLQEKRRAFYIVSLSCGVFDYLEETPIFREYHSLAETGMIKFGYTILVVTIQNPSNLQKKYRLEFDYWSMYGSIYHGGYTTQSLVFTCTGAPRIYEIATRASITTTKDKEDKNRKRLSFLNDGHKHIVATCFTYRVLLRDTTDIRLVHMLSNERYIPPLDRWIDRRFPDSVPYAEQLGKFLVLLTAQIFPFRIKYQLQMLVWNGELPPSTVIGLFPYAYALLSRRRLDVAVNVFQKLPRKLQRPCPNVDSSEFDSERLIEILTEIEEGKVSEFLDTGRPGHVHQNQTEVHRATVAPTGIYLCGPYPETQNRVLRRFSRFNDFFLRVEFVEETGDPIMYDITSNLDGIYYDRFRMILRDGIIIADRHFNFLGFSHSSLRARTCWFMANFICNGELVDVSRMIHKLGNFQHIYSPAKFAARIGQTFSDTLTSIAIDPRIVRRAEDVERNGRVFSDGCGTLSKEVLWKIYREYPLAHRFGLQCFRFDYQVRYCNILDALQHEVYQTNWIPQEQKVCCRWTARRKA